MLDTELKQRFLELPAFYREFVASDFAKEAAALYGESLKMNPDQVAIFEDGIILLLLFVFTKQDLSEYISEGTGISYRSVIPVVDALFESVHDFRKNSGFEDLRRPPSNTQPQLPSQNSFALPLRTMPMDMQHAVQSQQPIAPSEPPIQTPPAQIPVYQSSQSTILNQPAPQPPPYTPPTPRWDTDNRQ
jgi:hypothetical protein